MLSNSCTRLGVHAHCSILLRIFSASAFSSKPSAFSIDPKFAVQNSIPANQRPSQITTNLQYVPAFSAHGNSRIPDTVNASYVNSICSILCTHGVEKTNLDCLLRDFTDKLNSKLVLQILMNYSQLGRLKTLEFFYWAGMQMGFQFHESVVEYMADFLGRRKLFDDLKCLLITVSSNKCRVSCRTFAISIRFLGRQGRIEEALCLFEEMESKFNCTPDNLVYNNMLYVLCRKETLGHFLDIAITIFRRIKLPDTYSYSNVLVGLCKLGRFETALDLFGEMRLAGLVPTRSAVNVLIREFCSLSSKEGAIEKVRVKHHRRPFTILVPNVGAKSGAIGPAIGVFWKVNGMGLLPSAFVINRLISELCRLGRMEDAVGILNVVEQKRLTCAEESYTVVIKALCMHRQVDEVRQLFGRMLSHGFNPKLVVYNCIICMLCKLGNIDDAERVFRIMNKKRCLPDSVTYTALIHAYGEVCNWEAAHAFLMEMLGLGLHPHFHTYSLVDKLLREHRRMDLSIKLKDKMEFQALLKNCKEGQLEIAYEKLRSMLEMGILPPIYIKDAFEHAFQKAGKLRIASEMLEGIVIGERKRAESRTCNEV